MKFSHFHLIFLLGAALFVSPAPAASAQSSINWKTAIRYGKLVNIAENVSSTSNLTATDKQAIANLGYTYLATIYGSDLGTDGSPEAGVTVSYGFLAISSSGELVAAIRGTDSILEWIDDAQIYFVPNPIANSTGYTAEGFTAIYKSLRTGPSSTSTSLPTAIKSYIASGQAQSITVSGHSLGGALVTLLSLDLAHNSTLVPTSYTFASPRTGDLFFRNDYNSAVANSYRVYNATDIVPDLPLWPYYSVKSGFKLTPNAAQVDTGVACSHHMTTYLWLMGQQAGVDAGSLNSSCAK